jgi:hypothetical protein
MQGLLERMQLLERLRLWQARRDFRRRERQSARGVSADQARRDFRHREGQLAPGMSAAGVRQLFGEPEEICQYDDRYGTDCAWHYNHIMPEDWSLVLEFKDGKYSHSRYRAALDEEILDDQRA